MSLLTGWLNDLVGIAPKRFPTRLDESQVLAIARAAVSDAGVSPSLADQLTVRTVTRVGSELVWKLCTSTRGSGMSVDVSDADGRVIALRRHASR